MILYMQQGSALAFLLGSTGSLFKPWAQEMLSLFKRIDERMCFFKFILCLRLDRIMYYDLSTPKISMIDAHFLENTENLGKVNFCL